jgi:hypothetical protein
MPVEFEITKKFNRRALVLRSSPDAAALFLTTPELVRGVRERTLPGILQGILDMIHQNSEGQYVFMGSVSGFDAAHVADTRKHNSALYASALVTPEVAARIANDLRRPGSSADVLLALLQLVLPRINASAGPFTRAFAEDCLILQGHLLPSLAWLSPYHICRAKAAHARVLAIVGSDGALKHHIFPLASLAGTVLPRLLSERSKAAIAAGSLDVLGLFGNVLNDTFRVVAAPTTLGGLLPADAPLQPGDFVYLQLHGAATRDQRFLVCSGQRLIVEAVVAVAAALYPDAPPVAPPPLTADVTAPHADGVRRRVLDQPALPAADRAVIYDTLGDCSPVASTDGVDVQLTEVPQSTAEGGPESTASGS